MDSKTFGMFAELRREAQSIAKGDTQLAARIEYEGMTALSMGLEMDRCIEKMEEFHNKLTEQKEKK